MTAGIPVVIMEAGGGRVVINTTQVAGDILDVFGAGALIHLESATSIDGAYTAVDTAALVAGTEQYEIADAAGTASTWYKVRVSDSGSATFSDYSPAVRNTSVLAYGSVDDVIAGADGIESGRYPIISEYLIAASEAFDDVCGRSFHRDPQVSGTDTWTLDISRPHERSLAFANEGEGFTDGGALDLISCTTLEYRESEGDDYVELTEGTDFVLRVTHKPGWPFEDVVLMQDGALSTWPEGLAAVRYTGARGFATTPSRVPRIVAAVVIQAYRNSVMNRPQQIGVNRFGVSVVNTGRPIDWHEAVKPYVSPYVKRSGTIG